MFTGIIEEVGKVYKKQYKSKGSILGISCEKILDDLKTGDSISVNGICLTAREIKPYGFDVDVMPDTLKSTNLGEVVKGSKVNLERALKQDGRLDGHIVQGHVDGAGFIRDIQKNSDFITYSIKVEKRFLDYIVLKGSIAVDGISLTVQDITSDYFVVSTIPTTQNFTTLSCKKIGDKVNIETDIIGKYVYKFLNRNKNNLTIEKLLSLGY